ncbi:MAG: S8 family serine peptidase [Phycisphaerales bacterium]|nr:MAG: S8 family serine peptidase [Phycisphaerales bacterium]
MARKVQQTLILALAAWAAALVPPAGAPALAEPLDPPTILHPQALDFCGIYALRQIDPNLTGAGAALAVVCRSFTYIDNAIPGNDYRPNIAHNCFKNTTFTFYDQDPSSAGISPHSTAICSLLFGHDPAASSSDPELDLGQFRYQGIAPQARPEVYEFWHFLINNVLTQTPPEATVVTASFGQEFEGWWTRGIEALAEHHGLIVVAAIGNGFDTYSPPLYPGASANVIGVGVVDSVKAADPATALANFALAYPEHSSSGPAGAGHSKPDIVAPGNCLAADVNDPNDYNPTGSFSSFSTPLVAGAVGLLVQKAKQDPALSAAVSPAGGNCVIKAILLNAAAKLPYWHKGRLDTDDDHTAPLDHVQGAGMLDALAAYNQLTAGQAAPGRVPATGWDSNVLRKPDKTAEIYRITVPQPDGAFITVTAVWNRHYSNLFPFKPLPDADANLRLELRAVDPNNPDNDYCLDHSDSAIDNVEHIYVRADANYTDYEIVLSFSDADNPEEPQTVQPYALAWNTGRPENSDSILLYDLNADGIVEAEDVAIFVNNWLEARQTAEAYVLGDINGDGQINDLDADKLLDRVNLTADWRIE